MTAPRERKEGTPSGGAPMIAPSPADLTDECDWAGFDGTTYMGPCEGARRYVWTFPETGEPSLLCERHTAWLRVEMQKVGRADFTIRSADLLPVGAPDV